MSVVHGLKNSGGRPGSYSATDWKIVFQCAQKRALGFDLLTLFLRKFCDKIRTIIIFMQFTTGPKLAHVFVHKKYTIFLIGTCSL